MSASSIPTGAQPLLRALLASGRQYAVACGAGIALMSLLHDTPVHVASLRGAMAWASVLVVVRMGGWFAVRAWVDPPVQEPVDGGDAGAADAPEGPSRAA